MGEIVKRARRNQPAATRTVRVRRGGILFDVEMPTVESRFIPNFREPTTDAPGLVLTDAGDVYLVAADGTRTQLEGGGGGGGSFPTFFQLDAPDSPGDGDTWMRPAGGYPDQYGVGTFRWNADAGEDGMWQPVSGTVALDDAGSTLGIVSVGPGGDIIIEKYQGGDGDPYGYIAVSNNIFLYSNQGGENQGSSIDLTGGSVQVISDQGVTIVANAGGATGLIVEGGAEADSLQVLYSSGDRAAFNVGDDSGGIEAWLSPGYSFSVLANEAEVVIFEATLDGENIPTLSMGGSLDMGGSGITGLNTTPGGSTDAAPIAYVDKLARNVQTFSDAYTTGGIVLDYTGIYASISGAVVTSNLPDAVLYTATLNTPGDGQITVTAYDPTTADEIANGTAVAFTALAVESGAS